MRAIAWKVVAWVLIFVVAFFAGEIGRRGWDDAFVMNRVFSTSVGIPWDSLISYCFDLLFFFAVGLLTAGLIGSRWNWLWATAVGLASGVLQFHWTHIHFTSAATFSGQVSAYLGFVMPALGAFIGGISERTLSRWRPAKRRLADET